MMHNCITPAQILTNVKELLQRDAFGVLCHADASFLRTDSGDDIMKFSRSLLACTALSAVALLSPSAYAQADSNAPQATSEEEDAAEGDIIVTGSRIPTPQFEGVIPGGQVTAETIESRGFTSVLDALNDLPLIGPGASPIGNAGGQPASLGAAFVDLLDLGTARTLTLVNSRRFVSGNAGTLFVAANATGSQVDLNSIPTELIARTDVLTVGGAVAYGSDAIAGVVNVILRDDYEGIALNARAGVASRGDLFNYQLGGIVGTNFGGGRGNIAVSVQYNRDDGLQGDRRNDFAPNYIGPTFFGNGNKRNPSFSSSSFPIDITGANNGAFLRATDDGVPGNQFLPLLNGGNITFSDGGRVFQFLGALPTGVNATNFNGGVAGNQGGALQSISGATQLVPGGGVSGTTANGLSGNAPAVGGPGLPANTFTRFAPTSLPTGVTAAQVLAAFGVATPAQGTLTTTQYNTALTNLAINILQANRPTPREYLANNPNTPINAYLGSFIAGYLDVANTDPASSAFLPRTAVPLQFNSSGQLESYVPARFGAGTPATIGGGPGGDYYDPSRYTVLRTQQNRYIGNLIGHYDLTDNITFYTENLVSRVENLALRNQASINIITLGGTENAVLVASLNNPFLTDAQRAQLIASGVPTTGANANLFALSRSNQDISGDNQSFVETTTYRTVNGFKGNFGLFGRDFRYDVAGAYGLGKSKIGNNNIKDVEYALALDAVRDANGNIVCRVQTPGASTALPPGIVNTVLVRQPGPDGVLVETIVPRTVSASQIAGCQPLNPFGFNQMSQASKDYVTFRGLARNKTEQTFFNATLATSSLFDLPGGGVGFAVNGEWRRDLLDYRPNDQQRLGASRTAALAATKGVVTSIEASGELRIPLVGGDFTLPLIKMLEFSPGVRFVKQDGNAPDVRRLTGQLETNESNGKWETLYTLAGTWKPIDDILIRGNITRSLRQPSVVELFLGNQPAFNTPVDPCGNAQIGSGSFAANRRANCEQEVVRLGIAPDRASAATFLTTFVPAGQNLQGGFSGSPALKPEKGKSWTVGGVLTPRFIKGLTVSADYIDVEVLNQIIPTTLSNAAQFCYDSATFNDTSATLGVNTCSFFSRAATTTGSTTQFNIQNGFASGFINLGALKVRAVNGSLAYGFDVAELLGGGDKGRLKFTGNVYHLIDYISSASGQFNDNQNSAGSFFRPKWETQLTTRYETDSFFAQWTWNWQNKTKLFNANTGAFATSENQDVIDFPAFSVHDMSVGAKVNDNFSLQLTVRNLFDNRYAGLRGFGNSASVIGGSGQVDLQGRRFQMTARAKF
jgi:outer membrane receptor protein involved in Fe transport